MRTWHKPGACNEKRYFLLHNSNTNSLLFFYKNIKVVIHANKPSILSFHIKLGLLFIHKTKKRSSWLSLTLCLVSAPPLWFWLCNSTKSEDSQNRHLHKEAQTKYRKMIDTVHCSVKFLCCIATGIICSAGHLLCVFGKKARMKMTYSQVITFGYEFLYFCVFSLCGIT